MAMRGVARRTDVELAYADLLVVATSILAHEVNLKLAGVLAVPLRLLGPGGALEGLVVPAAGCAQTRACAWMKGWPVPAQECAHYHAKCRMIL